MTEDINIIISSKNRISNDTNSSVSVKLDKDIRIQPDEDWYVNMISFNMVKSFYACQAGLNDNFQVFFKSGDSIEQTYDIYLSQGNYSVKTLLEEIKVKCPALFDISYDVKLNKYLYKNNTFFDVYIKPKNAGIFLGFENGTEYQILAEGTYSSKFINVSGYTHMIIKLEGEINIDNTISNIYEETYQIDKVLGIFSLTDIVPMSTIRYQDAGTTFRYKILNDKIPKFTIKIVNEDGNQFPQMTDWVLSLRFEKVKKYNQQIADLQNMVSDLQFYIKSLYSALDIPSRITMADLQSQ